MAIREEPRPITIPEIPPPIKLCIDHISQTPMNNWCWVACAAMVLTYRQVSFGRMCCLPVFGIGAASADCCSAGGGNCDRPASKEQITGLYCTFAVPVRPVGPITSGDIIAQIDPPNESPVEIGYEKSGFGLEGSGHVILVFGRDSNGTSFFVHDPLNEAETTKTFQELVSPFNGGDWTVTWKDFGNPTTRIRRAC